jgi:hypothetical protein
MLKTKEEVIEWLHANTFLSDESQTTINPDLTIDVDGSIRVHYFGVALSSTRLPVKFGEITGSFDCSSIKLSSLIGSPKRVNGDFDCGDNQLSSLEGAPQQVDGRFLCNWNQLSSLEGSPQSVGGFFDCSNNRLTTLTGSPKAVGGYFDCRGNKLLSLQGAPDSVGGDFYSNKNPLHSIGVIETQIGNGKSFICSPVLEFASSARINIERDYQVDSTAFNSKITELKRIREEKALLEAQLAKLVEPYDRAKEGPLPSQKANKPKMKHKI